MSCLSTGQNAANWVENIGFAAANFIGIGDAIKNATGFKTPYDKLNDQLSDINSQTEAFRQQANIELFGKLIGVDQHLYNAVVLSNQDLLASINFVNESLKEKISLNTYYIMFIYIFFIIVYCYIMLKK